MILTGEGIIHHHQALLHSKFLQRDVTICFYQPVKVPEGEVLSLLLINDGQDLEKMGFTHILEKLYQKEEIRPVLFAGIHCGPERKMEYGTAGQPDYMNRGARAGKYTYFVMQELIPFIRRHTGVEHFRDKSFAGFSLGGLMALDIVWNHPSEFLNAGVFSGSLWWRSRGLDDGYVEDRDRIMHARVREGHSADQAPWLRFFFQTGVLDETADRNKNGVIDSIDDTLSLIDELAERGYSRTEDIMYLEFQDGRHDVATWGRAFPHFLLFAFPAQP